MLSVVIAVPLKMLEPIFFRVSGRVTVAKFVQPSKAEAGSSVIFDAPLKSTSVIVVLFRSA